MAMRIMFYVYTRTSRDVIYIFVCARVCVCISDVGGYIPGESIPCRELCKTFTFYIISSKPSTLPVGAGEFRATTGGAAGGVEFSSGTPVAGHGDGVRNARGPPWPAAAKVRVAEQRSDGRGARVGRTARVFPSRVDVVVKKPSRRTHVVGVSDSRILPTYKYVYAYRIFCSWFMRATRHLCRSQWTRRVPPGTSAAAVSIVTQTFSFGRDRDVPERTSKTF